MSNRIRYQKSGIEGTSVSVKVFLNGERSYRVYLLDRPLSFKVVELVGGDEAVVAEGVNTSPHKLKIAAKKALESLGVTFTQEVRIRNAAASNTPSV